MFLWKYFWICTVKIYLLWNVYANCKYRLIINSIVTLFVFWTTGEQEHSNQTNAD